MSVHSIITIVSGWGARIRWRALFQYRQFQLGDSMPKAACKMDTTPSVKSGKSSHDFISGFDVLNASVAELQALLNSGMLQSIDLMHGYLDNIERHNSDGLKLKAIISVALGALALV